MNTTDFLRFIAYVGYKFSNKIIMNAEIEYEHATTSSNFEGKSGSVSVEFAYLDFLINPAFNARGGNLLIPMGYLNLMHEPTTYKGNFRPTVETHIIPTTWREMGLGAHGLVAGVSYTAYVINGFNAAKFNDKGTRDSRQKANRAIWEDVGGVVAVDYTNVTIMNGVLNVGGSVFHGGADQNLVEDSAGQLLEVENQIYEAHAEVRKGPFSARALVTGSRISNAEALSRALFTDGTGQLTKQVPKGQFGWYAEAGYDVAPLIRPQASFTLTPWFRYEQYDLQNEVASGTGLAANPSLDGAILTLGLESKPHPNVVIKLDLVLPTHEADTPLSDEIRLGAGFIY